ncbi:hypothetical protein AXF19_03360 [Selenomonas sp. oral taxon 126]|uniref:tape measure protein n=1 Tax=Selenomonas sp. oral taxon 126 TaxID=712528 RepID=UPI0008078E7F|nr:tape measure protein [Selenomonas sp. oral taxon 126]ANR70122.1 hypothetical protein AXF19_03360 [Selenomonas sp. oral taxon 126]DAF19077.1 MAG TPA: tail tape measure protein [Caudoviricetes sp.]
MANPIISVLIRARDEAGRIIQNVLDQLNNLTDQTIDIDLHGAEEVTSQLGGIAKGALIAAVGIGSVAEALSAAKHAFIDYNAELEQTRVAFTSMLGSAEEANSVIGELQKFAAETPFEMPGIRDAAQQLLAFGYNADELIPTLTALGNAASGLGKGETGFGQLAFVFGQIRTTGKLMGNDVMQLAQLGVPVKDILAKNLGLTQEQLANIADQGIDANTAIRALIDGMNERFPEMMKKQSETFDGVLSNIKDNLGQAFGLSGLPVFEEAKCVLIEIKNITDMMLANAQDGKNLFAGILPDDLLAKVTVFGDTARKVFADLAPLLEPFLQGLLKVAKVLLDVGNIAVASLRPIAPIISLIGENILDTIGRVADMLDAVLSSYAEMQQETGAACDAIYADMFELWASVRETVSDFCTAVIEFIAGLVAEIADVVSPIVDTFAAAFQAAADFVYSAMATAAGYVRDFIAVVDEAIASVKELAVVKAATSLGNGITAVMDWVGGAVEETRERGRVSLAMHGFGSRKAIDSGAPDDGIIIPYRTDAPPAKDDEDTSDDGDAWSSVPQGASSGGRAGANAAEREAQRLAERIERLTEKVRQSVASLAHDVTNEVGTAYEKGMDALSQKMEQMQTEIAEASDLGIDTTALRAKLEEYANIVKEKVTKAWREANEDLRNETALAWAQVNKDTRAEAEAAYQIGVTRLAREKENRLKEVALTKDSAEARVAVEQWAAAEMAKLDRQRLEALRKSPQTTQEALRATLEEQYERLRDTGAQMKELTDSLFTSMADGFTSGFQNVLTDGFKGIQDAFSNMLKNMLNAIVKFVMNQMITRWLSMIMPAFGGSIPASQANAAVPGFRATGGPVSMGKAYIVGERGPEIFRPTQPGRIMNSLSGGTSVAPSIRVIVNNNTNERMTGTAETKFNGSEWVTTIMIDAIATNRNGMRDVIKGAV